VYKFNDVYVVTGPLWMPTMRDNGQWRMEYPLIGEHQHHKASCEGARTALPLSLALTKCHH
jgi:hypothetical protein